MTPRSVWQWATKSRSACRRISRHFIWYTLLNWQQTHNVYDPLLLLVGFHFLGTVVTVQLSLPHPASAADLRTKTPGFRGFDNSNGTPNKGSLYEDYMVRAQASRLGQRQQQHSNLVRARHLRQSKPDRNNKPLENIWAHSFGGSGLYLSTWYRYVCVYIYIYVYLYV